MKLLNNLKNPLLGPIRFELQPQGKKLWFLRPPRSPSCAERAERLGTREAGVPSSRYKCIIGYFFPQNKLSNPLWFIFTNNEDPISGALPG